MNPPKRMLVENVAWAAETAASDPAFFETLAQGQSPSVLWLGCSDSRMPAETITHSKPGICSFIATLRIFFLPATTTP